MNITVDTDDFIVFIPHLGMSFRRVMGAADTAAKDMRQYRRNWRISYKGVIIGNLQLASGTSNFD